MKQEKGTEKPKGIMTKGKEWVEKHPWWTLAAVGVLALVL